jgi:hypothetical protein
MQSILGQLFKSGVTVPNGSRTQRLALLALCLAAQSLRADLVFPDDFAVTRGWTFHRCETYGFGSGSSFTLASGCVDGIAYYGQSTTTGLYGVTYDFWSSVIGTVPNNGSAIVSVMKGIIFGGRDELGASQWVIIGSPYSYFNLSSITSGIYFSPLLYETSPILDTGGLFLGRDASCQCGLDQRFGTVGFTTVPEPATFVLVGSGLIAIGLAKNRRRRRANE